MLVKELIAELQKMPQDIHVFRSEDVHWVGSINVRLVENFEAAYGPSVMPHYNGDIVLL